MLLCCPNNRTKNFKKLNLKLPIKGKTLIDITSLIKNSNFEKSN